MTSITAALTRMVPTAAEDSSTLSAGITRAPAPRQPAGQDLGYPGRRWHPHQPELGRVIDLPRGSLSFDLGMTEAAGSGVDMTGALNWRQELANGSLSARLSRSVANDTDNDETLVTSLSLGMTQELNPRLTLNLGASWTQSDKQPPALRPIPPALTPRSAMR